MAPPQDVNAEISSLLLDLAEIHKGTPRFWGYKRAARTIRWLPQSVSNISENDLAETPSIGPATLRLIQEFLSLGLSPRVETAIEQSNRPDQIREKRELRKHFLSLAMVRHVLRTRRSSVVAPQDQLGDFQMHSRDSDGADTLAAMAAACHDRGYRYACITDHSRGLPIARGMSLETTRRQWAEIDRVNGKYRGRFTMFKGVEANILADGQLDLPADELREFDLIVASPHSALRKSHDQTARMLTAVTTSGAHILGHPRGRIYNSRAGIVADWPAVCRRAAEAGVAIEIDGDPSRQDFDHVLAAEVEATGCLFALDSDAHAVDQLFFADYALAHAQLAQIPPDRIINCWSIERLQEWAVARVSHSR